MQFAIYLILIYSVRENCNIKFLCNASQLASWPNTDHYIFHVSKKKKKKEKKKVFDAKKSFSSSVFKT